MSSDLQHAMENDLVKFQLVQPHNHIENLTERTIQTFKNY